LKKYFKNSPKIIWVSVCVPVGENTTQCTSSSRSSHSSQKCASKTPSFTTQ